ncbi:MAG: hypothetical protein IKH75_12115 [Ruminococcus sp.]|nr:hypothetical protein [Ruminococcus sp.]
MIDSEFNGNEELSEEETKAVLKNAKNTAKKVIKKFYEHPDKKESKLKFKEGNPNSKLNEKKNSSDTISKAQSKAAVKEAMKKAHHKQQQVKNAEKKRKAAATIKDAAEKAGKKVIQVVSSSKWGILIVILFLIVFMLFTTLATSCSSSFVDSGTAYIATSYMTSDEDLIACNEQLNNRENELREYIDYIPDYYIDWNEYNYYIDDIGHDPYQLLSYLSAMKINFKYDAEIQEMINKVYDSMYQLDIESVHEVRSETHIETDADGNETEVTVEYDYYILNIRLISRSIEEVVIQELKDAGVYDLYLAMMQTKGNKPDLF